jgi:hypothetical protein
MDYIFASMMKYVNPNIHKVLSYDIVCQWSRHLQDRLKALPSHIQLTIPDGHLRYAIPKLHIVSHKLHCQLNYLLNFLSGIRWTNGEGIECSWAGMNPVANSTKEMGPGSRHDMLDDHWSFWNWQKVVAMGMYLICPLIVSDMMLVR